MSTLRVDTAFAYVAPDGQPARCLLRLYDQGAGDVVLVATDLGPDALGPGVTAGIAAIATAACRRYGLDPARLTVLEHHDDRRTQGAPLPRGYAAGERFDLVTFAHVPLVTPAGVLAPDDHFARPAWAPLDKARVEARVGQPLP